MNPKLVEDVGLEANFHVDDAPRVQSYIYGAYFGLFYPNETQYGIGVVVILW